MSELSFKDRTIIVTGGGRGIGRGHAKLLASSGASVVVCDLGGDLEGGGSSAGPANEVVEEIVASGGSAVAVNESVASEEGAARTVAVALDTFGRIDGLINNAGNYSLIPLDEMPIETYRSLMDVHYMGSLFMTRAAWPALVENRGSVVNTISGAILGAPLHTGYGAAKGALFAFTRNAAVEGARHGVRVNAISPAAGTRMAASAVPALGQTYIDTMMATLPPELIAPAAAYLLHDSCPLNGEVLNVDGGRVSRLVVMSTAGISDPNLTPETVRDNVERIMDVSGARVLGMFLDPDPER